MRKEQLSSVLVELRNISKTINSEKSWNEISDKYRIPFLGNKYNVIYSVNLLYSLIHFFNIHVSIEELNQLIPEVCKSLKMKCEPMKEIDNLEKDIISCYSITLW